jgi:hypothetical protein
MKFFQRLKTFFKALFFHINAGLPKSSQDIIDYRYSICVNCERYNAKDQQCNECGCNISQKKKFLNKLAWADQKCPLEKW